MRYIQSLQSQVTPYMYSYIETLAEAFSDINTFIDAKLESETNENFLIAVIITTPFIGSLLFIGAVMLSA